MKSFVLKILFITAMLFSTSYLYSQQVQFTVKFNHETCAYGVYAKPDFTQTDFFVAGGSQITVVLPASVGNASVSVTSLEGGPWFDSSQIYAPTAASTLDFHAFSSNGSLMDFTAGVEVLLFTFELPDSCCVPGVRLFENGSDPDSSAPGMSGGDFNNYFADAFFFINYYNGNYNNSITVATPTGDAEQEFCAVDNPVIADLVTNEAGVVWYDAATNGNLLNDATVLTDNTIYYGALEPGSCASSVRFAVTVNVGDADAPTGDATQDFCAIDTPTVNDLAANEASVIWYDAPTGGNIINGTDQLQDGETYYGSQVIGSCSSSVRLAVTVNINNPPAPTTTDATQEFCGYASPALTNIQINESNITWYAASSGGSALVSGTALVNNTTYYASYTDAGSGCESTSRLPVTVTLTSVCNVTLTIKVMLQGALTGTVDNLMRDDLRASGLIPLAQPYNSALNARFTQVNNAGGETTDATVLNANAGTGDAVADWVFIEIRDGANAAEVIKTVSALVQRDGDVMAADGGPFMVAGLPESFFVSVKHRNHFGAMGANALTVTGGQATIDFTTLTGTALFSLPGNDSGLSMAVIAGGLRALYAGNANYDIRVKYDGLTNDRQTMGGQVLSHTDNSANALNFSNATGYFSGDINMDGKVLYDGLNNDRGVLQNIVINYPENTSDLNNYNNMTEQIPQ